MALSSILNSVLLLIYYNHDMKMIEHKKHILRPGLFLVAEEGSVFVHGWQGWANVEANYISSVRSEVDYFSLFIFLFI